MNNLEKETMEMAKRAARKYVYDEIDWEQRRYEIAKEILPVMVNLWYNDNKGFIECYEEEEINPSRQPEDFAASEAVLFADALIKELKGGKPCE